MSRPPRLQEPGEVFHVTARGVRRQAIFFDDRDYRLYLNLLARTNSRYAWLVLAYCLMPNHVHLVVSLRERCLSAAMHRQHGLYARRFNERHLLTGHTFEARFRSRRIEDDADLVGVMRYVAVNPVEAGLCDDPLDWPWSSHRAVAGEVHHGSPVHVSEARAVFGPGRRGVARYRDVVASGRTAGAG
jgi:REP element-mobilizing transposase RayT